MTRVENIKYLNCIKSNKVIKFSTYPSKVGTSWLQCTGLAAQITLIYTV